RAVDTWYRKYAPTEMKDVKYCFSFILDPLTWHSSKKKIVVPGDIKGMKVRPSQATVAAWVTLLGGTNVQASATEVRDVMEKGVAEAVTFPWGSVPQLDEWKKSAEPLEKQWAENVRKAGGDPDTIMKELKQSLAQYKAGY